MRIRQILCLTGLALVSTAAFSADTQHPKQTLNLDTPASKLSYAFGYVSGTHFKHDKTKIDSIAFAQGVKDGLIDQNPLIPRKTQRDLIHQHYKQLEKKVHDKFAKSAQHHLEHGQTFLADNAKKEGIHTTDSGLQYKVLTEGTGPKPTVKDTVKVDYEGALTDGHVFDSSFKRGQPATFPLGHVIPGWIEGLQLMPEGSTWMLYIPADQAYGSRGVPGQIPPNSVLIFKVHLIKIEKAG